MFVKDVVAVVYAFVVVEIIIKDVVGVADVDVFKVVVKMFVKDAVAVADVDVFIVVNIIV